MAIRSNASGGHGSRVVVEKPVRTGVGNRGVSVGVVGQLGQLQGSHVTNRSETGYRGEGKFYQGAALRPAMLGNEKALDVGPGGCGTGRTIYASGSQGTQGSVNPGNPRPVPSEHPITPFGPNKRSY